MSRTASDIKLAQVRRAYRVGIANGIFFAIGMAFVDPVTVLPTFVSRLTDSEMAVGLVSAIGMSGWFLPQLFAASYLQARPYKRPLYIFTAFLRGSGWLFGIPLIYLLAPRSAVAALTAFFLCYSLYSFGGGLGGPAFLDIVAKTVPAGRLGAFFGHRQFWGGIGAVAAGLLVRTLLAAESLTFPLNYCLLFALALANFAPGWAIFASVHEPPGRTSDPQPLLLFLRSAPALIREHPEYRILLISRILWGCAAIALPFYIIYCRRVLNVSEAAVGTYLSLQMAGSIVFIPLWAYLNDRKGPRTLLVAVGALGLAIPTSALIASLVPSAIPFGRLAFGLVFFPLASIGGGSFMGYTNYLFAIAPEEQRPLYIGVQNTLFAVTSFLPLLGALIVSLSSFQVLFSISTCLSIAALAAVTRLPPRGRAEPG
jgi:MFS family permease